MLVNAEQSDPNGYVIAINNSTGCAELMSDFSYLEEKLNGILTFDFSHITGGLTQEKREEYLPGGFGYQPTQQLLEVVAAIASYTERRAICPHQLRAILPNRNSHVGKFLFRMGTASILRKLGVQVEFVEPSSPELGKDDVTRKNLIPLTIMQITNGIPDFSEIGSLRNHVERVFKLALPNDIDLANSFTSIISEAVDNMIEYGGGGIIGGLYYPRIGEVEITLANRYGKFGGSTPEEEREALIRACEGSNRPSGGGNGISQLSRLAMMSYGTLLLRNGNASLRLMPDGSIASTIDETGLPAPLASVTILLQFLPIASVIETEALKTFKSVLQTSLEQYLTWKGLQS